MARTTLDLWIPEEKESAVLQALSATSVIESEIAPTPMGTNAKSVNRSSATQVDVISKGGVYGEDGSANDDVILTARKFGKVFRLAEEDIDDSPTDIINAKKNEWALSFAKTFDNACLGTSAAANGSTVPFTSLWRALTTADAAVGYTASANVVKAVGATPTYDELNTLIGIYENSDFFDESNGLVIASPSFKKVLRGIKDSQGEPIFVANGRNGDPDTLIGYPIRFTKGAQITTVATGTPGVPTTASTPLVFIGNKQFLIRGVRSGPESVVIDGMGGASALTDETLLKMRARRGFVVGNVQAWAGLWVTI
jgi:HK97 family phage major capsid protein